MQNARVHRIRFGTSWGPSALAWGDRGLLALKLPGSELAQLDAWLARRLPEAEVLDAVIEGGSPRETRPGEVFPGAAEASAEAATEAAPEAATEAVAEAVEQVREWFDGRRRAFDLPLDLRGTPFQREVWTALAAVPHGTTITYAELARRIGRPRAVRAVGAANGANPIPLIVPCHRVVASGGGLGGFTGGLELKRRLLAHEGVATGLLAF